MEVGCVGGSGLVKEDIYEGRPGSCVTSAALRTGTETVHFGTCHTNQATGRHPPYVARTRRESLYKQSDTVRVGRLGRFCPFVKPSDTQVEDSVMSVRYEYWNACDFVIVPVRKYNVSIGGFVIKFKQSRIRRSQQRAQKVDMHKTPHNPPPSRSMP